MPKNPQEGSWFPTFYLLASICLFTPLELVMFLDFCLFLCLKWSTTLWSLSPMSSACLLSVEKLAKKIREYEKNQRNENMQKQGKQLRETKL